MKNVSFDEYSRNINSFVFGEQCNDKSILCLLLQIMYEVPAFTVASEGSVTGEIQAYVTNDAEVTGNLTVQLWAKSPANASDDNYKKVGDPIKYDVVSNKLIIFTYKGLPPRNLRSRLGFFSVYSINLG